MSVTVESLHGGEGSQLNMSYNPFLDYIVIMGVSNNFADEQNMTQKVLESNLIQELLPVEVLKTDPLFNWEFTTVICVEAEIARHLSEFPTHLPILDQALELWRAQNRDAILGNNIEKLSKRDTKLGNRDTKLGNHVANSQTDSVADEILQATLTERNVELDLEEFQNLANIINCKIILEYLYMQFPIAKRMLFAKISSYFESGQLKDFVDLNTM
ncbi:uncharacterized protein LOC120352312 isoform X2 [Nilaparvata lugens]|nr:uncharacterized protein LOC120352312 isoform X2 [Nilaparvata lugens]